MIFRITQKGGFWVGGWLVRWLVGLVVRWWSNGVFPRNLGSWGSWDMGSNVPDYLSLFLLCLFAKKPCQRFPEHWFGLSTVSFGGGCWDHRRRKGRGGGRVGKDDGDGV